MANSICSVKNCLNKKNSEISLFSVPKILNIREKWIEFLKSSGKSGIRNGTVYRICEKHFSPSSIKFVNGKKMLIPGSLPVNLQSEVSLNYYLNMC